MAVTSDSSAQAGSPPPPRGPAAGRARGGAGLGLFKRFLTLREGSIIVVTLITVIYFASSTSHFFSGNNFKTLLPFFAPIAIMAAGQVFVMTLGEIDLSIGAMYLFTPFLYYKLSQAGIPIVPSLIIALLVVMALGAFNGFAVAYIGIPSFVTTLGMLFVLDGVTLVISHSEQVTMPGTSVVGLTSFSRIFGAGTYSELIWALGLVAVLQIVLSFTRWGLYTVAVGGNRLGAAEAGINVKLVLVRNFMLCAVTAGFVGVLEAVRSSSASPDPSGSNAILLQAISAVIIGGTLMTGGAGTVIGALIGALFLGILNDGLVLKGVNGNYLDLYLGIAILIAMTVNVYIQRVRTGSSRG
jgi:simple sugar transport system permease protein